MSSPSVLRLAVCAAVGVVACPALAADPPTEPSLRLSRELAPASPPRGAPRPGAEALPAPARQLDRGIEEDKGVLFLRADRLEGDAQRVEAGGRVELRARRQTVLADTLTYEFATQVIHGTGNVVLRQGSDYIMGPELTFKRDSETGFFMSPTFSVGDVGARGDAAKLTFVGPDRYHVENGRYTTCVAPREDWFLDTRELDIDMERKVGTAHGARVEFFNVPVMYAPWLEFPLSNERKSGFLTPTAGSTGVRGFEFAIPYYFNLAPNYDATVTPRLMTKRGLQLGGEFRYLFDSPQPMAGQANVEVLPKDRQTDTTRYLLAWKHNEQLLPWMAGYLNLNKVSDDKYFADLSDRVAVTSQTTLPREGGVAAAYGPFEVLARMQSFQTLQDPNAPITPPYNRLPQVIARLNEYDWQGMTFTGFGEYARFRQPSLLEGSRAVLHPSIALTRQGPAWFVTARAGVNLRDYALSGTPQQLANGDNNRSVTVPITSLDGGLVFERDMSILGRSFIQTLEPRAFYVYIPYRQQNDLPVFDTALDDFNFLQLFSENRYLGNDRIGDANQLSLAATSRLLDPATGAERMRVAIGQRFYFADQRVTLPGEAPRSASSSDILAGVDGRLSDAWLLNALTQFNLDTGTIERFNVGARWTPKPGRVINGTWRYTRQVSDSSGGGVETLKQFDLATQWPISANWTLLARWNYSLPDRKTLEALAGVEYNADCWIVRAVLHRLTTTTQQTTTSVFIQLELTGLARIGTSPLELLRRSVPGYLRSNDPALRTDPGLLPYPEF